MSHLAAYRELLALTEEEHRLVADGAWDDAARVAADRASVVAGLPDAPPAGAGPLLARAAGVQALTTAALASGRAATADDLRSLGRGRTALAGYAAAGRDS